MLESNGISLLRIEPVRAGRDDAPYECIAENGVGDAVSAEATLTVYEADKTPAGFPVIEVCGKQHRREADLHINHISLRQIQSNSRVIEIGHTAVLQCKAMGNPTPPKVHWLKDMKRVELSSRYTLLDGSFLRSSDEFEVNKTIRQTLHRLATDFSKRGS